MFKRLGALVMSVMMLGSSMAAAAAADVNLEGYPSQKGYDPETVMWTDNPIENVLAETGIYGNAAEVNPNADSKSNVSMQNPYAANGDKFTGWAYSEFCWTNSYPIGNGRMAGMVAGGIDKEVIQFYYQKGMIYECSYDHSVVFVGYDEKGIERYASKRATDGDWKMDVFNSNKEYSFQLVNKESDVLNIFESAIDLMSFQTLEKLHKRNWKKNNYLSLSGVTAIGNSIEESELPIALGKFLEINPQIKVLNLYLDNDQAGNNSIEKINYLLGKSYQIYDKGPKKMKDVNEVLTRKFKQKEKYSR